MSSEGRTGNALTFTLSFPSPAVTLDIFASVSATDAIRLSAVISRVLSASSAC